MSQVQFSAKSDEGPRVLCYLRLPIYTLEVLLGIWAKSAEIGEGIVASLQSASTLLCDMTAKVVVSVVEGWYSA